MWRSFVGYTLIFFQLLDGSLQLLDVICQALEPAALRATDWRSA
jgi:hypothetical protein